MDAVEAYLAKARQSLLEARAVLEIDLAEAAGRAAYLAAFHAAQAYIVHATGKSAKTHSGVRIEFARLTHHHPVIDRSPTLFLAQAYNLKSIADYAIDGSVTISLSDAADAINRADGFVQIISTVIAPNGG